MRNLQFYRLIKKQARRAAFLSAALIFITAQGQAEEPVPPAPPAETSVPPAITPPPNEVSTGRKFKLRILAKGSGVPLRRATIKAGDKQQFSDPEGNVSIEVGKDVDSIQISRNGYKTESFDVDELPVDGVQDVFLYPGKPDDNEVIVRGVRRQEVSRKTVSAAESRALVPSGDPAQITRLLPGVQTQAFRPEVIVRGSGPNDTRYYVDQVQVPYLFHGFGSLSIIEPDQLSEVEFYSGGFGAQYGNAMGGIVILRTKEEIPERPMTDITMNLPFFSSVYHERPLSEDSSLSVSLRRSYVDYFLPKVMPKDSDAVVLPYFGDGQVVYQKKSGDDYNKLSLLTSYDGIKLVFNSNNATTEDGRGTFDIYAGFMVLADEIRSKLDSDWQYTTTPQIAWTKVRQNILDFKIDIDSYRVGAPLEVTKRLSPKEKLYVGLDPAMNYFLIDIVAPQPPAGDPTFDFEEAPKISTKRVFRIPEVATWVAADKQLGDLTVTPGLRGFYNSQIKRTSLDPRVSARYTVDASNTAKASVGQFSEDPGQGAEASEEFGNPKLDFQRSIHYVLGYETVWNDLWNTDFQLFHKKAYKLVRSDSETRYNNSGSLRSSGAEAFIRRSPTARMFGWLSYTYSVTEERDRDEDSFRPAQYDQTHVLNLASNYRFTGQFQLGNRLGYHTGDRYTPVSDVVYNANLDKYQKRIDDDDRYAKRLPPFYQIDLFLQNDLLFDTSKLLFRYGVQFLALQRQAFGTQYNYDYSKEEYFRGVPPIPYLEVKGQF